MMMMMTTMITTISVLFAYHKYKMADCRYFEEIETSPYFSNGSTDRHDIWHGDAQ